MSSFPETRYSLIARLGGDDDQDAWREFVSIYRPAVYRIARRRGLQHADAEDLSQQVFAQARKAIGRFEPNPARGKFRSWLATIAKNASNNALVRKPRDMAVGGTTILELLDQQLGGSRDQTEVLQLELRRSLFRWAAERVREEFHESTWKAFWRTTVDGKSNEQINSIGGTDLAKYDGVALHADGATAQLDVINELAGQAKLVTVGEDVEGSKRLCHVAFSEFENGREVARIVREATKPSDRTILLISTAPESDTEMDGNVRLRGFQLEWDVTEQLRPNSTLRIFKFKAGQSNPALMQDLTAAIAEPDVGAIVAFDPHAADCVLVALTARRSGRQMPVFAFDPTAVILDAIEDGRVECAIRNDPFFCGYEAVRRLAIYAPKPDNQLPVAGLGE